MTFLDRYAQDGSRPSVRSAVRDIVVRAVLPGVLLWAAIVGFGLLLTGPLTGLSRREESLNRSLAAGRTSTMDTVTLIWSHAGNTEYVIAICVLVVGLVWWRTRQWWYAAIPALAISLQASVFVLATLVVARPRPEVSHLDVSPPTSSYPSGHVGASTALWFTLALMALRIRTRALRVTVVVLCSIVPFLVAYARLYRGMHHLSDVVVGGLNGVVCLVLAWHYLRRADARARKGT